MKPREHQKNINSIRYILKRNFESCLLQPYSKGMLCKMAFFSMHTAVLSTSVHTATSTWLRTTSCQSPHTGNTRSIPLLSGCEVGKLVQKAMGLDLKRLKLNPRKIKNIHFLISYETNWLLIHKKSEPSIYINLVVLHIQGLSSLI